MMYAALHYILHAVPGLTGSQLQSRVDATLPECDTDGFFSGLWISLDKFLFNRPCFVEELTYVA